MDTYTIKDSGSDRQWILGPREPKVTRLPNRMESQILLHVISVDGNLGNYVEDNRLVLVPRPEFEKVRKDRDDYLNVSGVCTTRDEALEYFAFLMMQAANLFEAIEDDRPSRDELARILKARGESEDGPMIGAALAYFDTAKKIHDDMKSED